MSIIKKAVSAALVAIDREAVRDAETGEVNHKRSAAKNRRAAADEFEKVDDTVGEAGLTVINSIPLGVAAWVGALITTAPARAHAHVNEAQADAHDALWK